MFYYFVLFSSIFFWFYISYSYYQTYKSDKKTKSFKFFFFLIHSAFLLTLILNPRLWENKFDVIFSQAGTQAYYFLFGIMSLLLFSFLLKDLLILFVLRPYQKIKKTEEPRPERRKFLKNSFSLFALSNTTLVPGLGFIAATRPLLRDVFIHDPIFPKAWGEIRALQISDLHVGPIIKRDYVEYLREMILWKKPHFIFYTGDMVDGNVSSIGSEFDPIKDLRGSLGNFFVTGNHEYYSGASQWNEFFSKEMGCQVLLNQHSLIDLAGGKLLIGGVTDYTAARFDKSQSTDPFKARGKEEAAYSICLAHQPKSVFKVKEAGFDFMCCGHTHGGQYFPFNLIVNLVHPYVRGLYNHKGMPIYVNPGTGYWGPPNRFGIPAEVTHLIFNHKGLV